MAMNHSILNLTPCVATVSKEDFNRLVNQRDYESKEKQFPVKIHGADYNLHVGNRVKRFAGYINSNAEIGLFKDFFINQSGEEKMFVNFCYKGEERAAQERAERNRS